MTKILTDDEIRTLERNGKLLGSIDYNKKSKSPEKKIDAIDNVVSLLKIIVLKLSELNNTASIDRTDNVSKAVITGSNKNKTQLDEIAGLIRTGISKLEERPNSSAWNFNIKRDINGNIESVEATKK